MSVGRGGDLSCPLQPWRKYWWLLKWWQGQASNSKEEVRKFLVWWNHHQARLNSNSGGFYYSFRKVADVKQGLLSPYLLRKSLNFWKNEIANLTLHFHRCVTRKFFPCRSSDNPDRNIGGGGRRLLGCSFLSLVKKEKKKYWQEASKTQIGKIWSSCNRHVNTGRSSIHTCNVALHKGGEKQVIQLQITYFIWNINERQKSFKTSQCQPIRKVRAYKDPSLKKMDSMKIHNKEVYSWSTLFPFRKISFTNLSKTS